MSGELTKSQELSEEIIDADIELSDQDLEDVAGGSGGQSNISNQTQFGSNDVALNLQTNISVGNRDPHHHHHPRSC